MTDAQIKNILWYLAIAVAGAVVATGVQLGATLSGTDPIQYRPLAATFVTTLFAALATAAGTSFRPRVDRADISHLVSRVGPEQAKAALENEATRQIVGVGTDQPFTPTQIQQIADELEARMQATPAPAEPAGQGDEHRAEGRG